MGVNFKYLINGKNTAVPNKIIVFGAGYFGNIMIAIAIHMGVEVIECFDNDENKQGTLMYNKIKCVKPHKCECPIVIAIANEKSANSIKNELSLLGNKECYVLDTFKARNALNSLSDKAFLDCIFYLTFGRTIDWFNPQTYNEKLQWLKLYNRKKIYTNLVDKYGVKEYIGNTIGKKYVIPTLGVWNTFDDIDFNKMPDKFVLKCTHDSGGLVIIKDKTQVNLNEINEKMTRCLKHNFYFNGREWPYKDVTPRIIAEEYLENNKDGLHDYKVWCFNGRVEYIQYITGRVSTTYESFYDRDWNKQNFCLHNMLMESEIPRPPKLEELINIAEKLSSDIPFVRIDFYILESGELKFGEITFFPMAGFEHWHPEEMDLVLGKMINLDCM